MEVSIEREDESGVQNGEWMDLKKGQNKG